MPMAELRSEMKTLGFKNVQTLLNSGNLIFDGDANQQEELSNQIANHLKDIFDFSIPVLIRTETEFRDLFDSDPFQNVEVTEDIRLYATFLKERPKNSPTIPWISEDKSFRIIEIKNRAVCSILNLSATTTTKGMNALEQFFGNEITTRNWKTVSRIADKLIEQ